MDYHWFIRVNVRQYLFSGDHAKVLGPLSKTEYNSQQSERRQDSLQIKICILFYPDLYYTFSYRPLLDRSFRACTTLKQSLSFDWGESGHANEHTAWLYFARVPADLVLQFPSLWLVADRPEQVPNDISVPNIFHLHDSQLLPVWILADQLVPRSNLVHLVYGLSDHPRFLCVTRPDGDHDSNRRFLIRATVVWFRF